MLIVVATLKNNKVNNMQFVKGNKYIVARGLNTDSIDIHRGHIFIAETYCRARLLGVMGEQQYFDNSILEPDGNGLYVVPLEGSMGQYIKDSTHSTVVSGRESAVDKPLHYEVLPEIEAIDIIRSTLTEEQWAGYCLGNIIKYRLRAGKKDDTAQDIAKADKYRDLYEEKL